MAQRATKKINLNIKGIIDIDDNGKIIVTVEIGANLIWLL